MDPSRSVSEFLKPSIKQFEDIQKFLRCCSSQSFGILFFLHFHTQECVTWLLLQTKERKKNLKEKMFFQKKKLEDGAQRFFDVVVRGNAFEKKSEKEFKVWKKDRKF
jgi:hypothetical protein